MPSLTLPIKVDVTKILTTDQGTVEVYHRFVDGAGEELSKGHSFVCKPGDFEVVAHRYLDEFVQSLGIVSARDDINMPTEVRAVLASVRKGPTPVEPPPTPTPNDQNISPPGISGASPAAGKRGGK